MANTRLYTTHTHTHVYACGPCVCVCVSSHFYFCNTHTPRGLQCCFCLQWRRLLLLLLPNRVSTLNAWIYSWPAAKVKNELRLLFVATGWFEPPTNSLSIFISISFASFLAIAVANENLHETCRQVFIYFLYTHYARKMWGICLSVKTLTFHLNNISTFDTL